MKMSVQSPKLFPKFSSMKEMMDHYYPEDAESLVQKTDAPLLSSTTGWWNVIYGKKVWAQLNYEANAFGLLPKIPWRQTGWRVETAYPVAAGSWPTGGVAENATISDSDSIMPTWDEIKTDPKSILHFFDSSKVATFLQSVDDSLDIVAELRKAIGIFHVSQVNEMLMTDNDTLAGNNIESIDRVVGSHSELDCGMTAGDLDIYDIDRDADVSWADAVVNHASNVDRVLTLKLIDDTLKDIRQAGGMPKVILTGWDTLNEWQGLLEASRRFMQTATVVPTFNGIQGAGPGVEAGFNVATYQGIPIIPTHRCTKDTISRIYFLDTDYLFFKVATPTLYEESHKSLELDRLGMRGAYHTMGELICTNFGVQGKLRDLKTA